MKYQVEHRVWRVYHQLQCPLLALLTHLRCGGNHQGGPVNKAPWWPLGLQFFQIKSTTVITFTWVGRVLSFEAN